MKPVLTERRDAVGIVTLNRPEKRNALDLTMRAAISEAVRELDADASVRVIIITGGEKVFAAGADLNLLVDKGAQDVADIVSGFALGAGCEMAMMCDFIVCDASARFGQTEARVGIMPGAGGTQRLIRTVGKQVASMMLMTGEFISGERAYQLGLVADLVTDGTPLERAIALANTAASMPPKALVAIKRSLAQGADLPLDAALTLENREFLLLFDTQDKTEGMRAFLEKRSPTYTGQ